VGLSESFTTPPVVRKYPVPRATHPTLASLKCIGKSRRPLYSTFNRDALELGKLQRFFA
jgi:hypothetical protein